MSDSLQPKIPAAPTGSDAEQKEKKRDWTPIIVASIAASGAIGVALINKCSPEPRAPIKEAAPREPVFIDGICIELLGCETQLDGSGICQLKIATLMPDPALQIQKDSIVLVAPDGQNLRPANMGIAGGSAADILPFPTALRLPQSIFLGFADVGGSLDDYDKLRIEFGPDKFADFPQPGKYFNSGKNCLSDPL